MKILIDLTSLYDHLSGIERYAKELSISLLKQFKEHDYVLVFKNEIAKGFEEFESENVQTVIINGGNKLIFNQLKLPKALKKIKADAYLFLAFPEPVLFNKKNIFTAVHDVSAFDCSENMKFLSKWYFRISNKHSFKNCRKIITISEFSKRRIGYYSKKAVEKTEIVYCGCIGENYKTAKDGDIRLKYNLPEKYLLTLSTLEPRKNLKLLLDAYERLIQEQELPKLVLAGRLGWKMEHFLDGYSEALKERLVFTGFIDDEDLSLVYSNADAFIFPSKYEGFGMPPLEAMRYKTPVLSSDSTSLPEVLGDAAMYFESENVESLKNKILDIFKLDNEDKQRMVQKGNERADFFSWDREAVKLEKIIRASV